MTAREFMKTLEVAKVVGVSGNSINLWANTHYDNIPTTEGGHRMYTKDHVEYFKKVKTLLKTGLKHTEIIEKLASKKIVLSLEKPVSTQVATNETVENKFSVFNSIPAYIFDKMDFKSIITNDDIKYLFNRIAELEAVHKI
jgi:DNA-binding transcriptional MerR regulator